MNRIQPMKVLLLLCYAYGMLFTVAPIQASEAKRNTSAAPNFLIIITDDQRYDGMSCAGNSILKTPNIDRIAEGGMRFTNAFVTQSLCAPSRACILTGKYSHANGVLKNSSRWKRQPILTDTLHEAGYESAYIGKCHKGTNLLKTKFTHWLGFNGQGAYHDMGLLDFDGKKVTSKAHTTGRLADLAVTYLEKHCKSPFCLFLAFKAPHIPYEADSKYTSAFSDAQIPYPPNWDEGTKNRPNAVKVAPQVKDLDFVKGRYRLLLGVDAAVGKLLDSLTRLNLDENTVIIFTSDNGFFHGEFKLWNKRFMYEPSIRVPLLIKYPKLISETKTHDAMTLNIDLAPTILDLAGRHSDEMQGRSLEPLLTNKDVPWPKDFYYAYYEHAKKNSSISDNGIRIGAAPAHRGIRTERYKYIEYYLGRPFGSNEPNYELLDMLKDPHEQKNLYDNPEYHTVLKDLRARMAAIRKETNDPTINAEQ